MILLEITLAQKESLPQSTKNFMHQIFLEGTAENTLKAYKKDLGYFKAWLEISGLGKFELNEAISVNTILRFVSDHLGNMDERVDDQLVREGVKAKLGPHCLTTIKRRLASISVAHKIKGLESPTASSQVKENLKRAGKAPSVQKVRINKKRAITKDILDAMLKTCDMSLIGVRDRAILLFMAASGGRRRSETIEARAEDLTTVEGGYLFNLRRSKTDQEGKGSDKPVLGKAGRALKLWIESTGIQKGPLFRPVTRWGQIADRKLSGEAIRLMVKKRVVLMAKNEGADNNKAKQIASKFGAHSLRSGFVTQWGRAGGSRVEGMALTGHKSVTVFDGYYQVGDVLNNPAARIFD